MTTAQTNKCLLNDSFLMESELEKEDEVSQMKQMDGAGSLNGNSADQVSKLQLIHQFD